MRKPIKDEDDLIVYGGGGNTTNEPIGSYNTEGNGSYTGSAPQLK